MHIGAIMWANYLPLMKEAADALGIRFSSFSTKQLNADPALVDDVKALLRSADCILVYRTNDAFWDEIEPEIRSLRDRVPVVSVSTDPSFWELSSVTPEIVVTAYRYILYNGRDNMANMFRYLLHSLFDQNVTFNDPEEVPWQGLFHPAAPEVFQDTESYLSWYSTWLDTVPERLVGLLCSRSAWATDNIAVERSLIASFEAMGIGVIPVFFYPLKDSGLGNLGGVEVIERFFLSDGKPIVDGIIKLTVFFLGNSRGEMKTEEAPSGVGLMRRLNIPIFSPLISYYKNAEQWLHDPTGLSHSGCLEHRHAGIRGRYRAHHYRGFSKRKPT